MLVLRKSFYIVLSLVLSMYAADDKPNILMGVASIKTSDCGWIDKSPVALDKLVYFVTGEKPLMDYAQHLNDIKTHPSKWVALIRAMSNFDIADEELLVPIEIQFSTREGCNRVEKTVPKLFPYSWFKDIKNGATFSFSAWGGKCMVNLLCKEAATNTALSFDATLEQIVEGFLREEEAFAKQAERLRFERSKCISEKDFYETLESIFASLDADLKKSSEVYAEINA